MMMPVAAARAAHFSPTKREEKMQIFEENGKRDLFMNEQNQLGILTAEAGVAQATKSAVEIEIGSALYNVERGVALEESVRTGTANLQQFEFYARKQISSVPDVVAIVEFNAEISANTIFYTAIILTTFGQISFSDTV